MASVTSFSRLEPRPRSGRTIQEALAAKVRDPLWMLTRQWQFGELRGEDAASPAWVDLRASVAPFTGWRAEPDGAATVRPLDPGVPLEALAQAEPVAANLRLRVELGHALADALADLGRDDLLPAFLAAFRLATYDDSVLSTWVDQAGASLARAAGGRVVDGVAVLDAAGVARPAGLPPELSVAAGDEADAGQALDALLAYARSVYGEVGTGDADAWRAERLEYGLDVVGGGPDGTVVLSATPGSRGEFDWHSFDQREVTAGVTAINEARVALLPVHVRFRGMPNPRWWSFERAGTDLGKVRPDRRGVAMLVGLDFMLVHSNDWYVAPLPVDVGTVSWVERLVVHDVFGGTTAVQPVEASRRDGRGRWSMFSTSVAGDDAIAGYLVVPPSAGTTTMDGPALEDVRFVRDEMANMVWAIEHTTEDEVGQPWPGHERALVAHPPPPPPGPAPEGSALRYLIQTVVPGHWIPFVPVSLDPVSGEIALEQAVMTRPSPVPGDPPVAVEPVGRVLRNPPDPYRVREEEVPREGRRVTRAFNRTRWVDGSTHLWVSRRSTVGRGEASSGLRFDVADPVAPPPPS